MTTSAESRGHSMADHSHTCVTITGLFHDLVLKRSSVSVVWSDDPDKRMNLPIPYGCALDDIQAEAERPCVCCPTWPRRIDLKDRTTRSAPNDFRTYNHKYSTR
jgi:hypothetical protein